MTDWARGYQQRIDFYVVDAESWGDDRLLENVSAASAASDIETRLVESASISADFGTDREAVVRAYLTASQGGVSERVCLGTWLGQTPRRTYHSAFYEVQMDCYGMLKAVDDVRPPYGFSIPAGANCAEQAAAALSHGLAPVVGMESDKVLSRAYVPDPKDTWLDVAMAMADAAGLRVDTDAYGRCVLAPAYGFGVVSWTFRDDDESVLLPDAEDVLDWYGLPNVCELVWTGPPAVVGRAVNDDPTSAISTASRGREVVLRRIDPTELASNPTKETADLLALKELENASCAERSVTIRHGLCPVRKGDRVRISWKALGLECEGRVVRQDMELATGIEVASLVKVTARLWR